jgi:hypothetical protein
VRAFSCFHDFLATNQARAYSQSKYHAKKLEAAARFYALTEISDLFRRAPMAAPFARSYFFVISQAR